MRRLLSLLALSFATACSADQFVTPSDGGAGNDATSDVSVPDAISPDANPVVDSGGQVDAGIGPPVLVNGIPANVDLFGVWGQNPSDYWVVGADKSNQGFVGHWTGNAFVNTNGAAPAPFRAVWGTANGVLIVGDKDPNTNYALASYVPQGQAMAPLGLSAPLAGRSLVSVWYEESSTTYFLQTEINILARSLTPYTSAVDISGAQIPATAGLCYAMHARYVACDGGVYGPASSGPVAGSAGPKWRAIRVANQVTPVLFVAGQNGILARGSGALWQSLQSNTTENLEGIWSNIAGETVIVGAHGTILAMLGLLPNPTVVSVPSPNSENLHAVTVVGAGQNRIFVAVGSNGTVVTRKF